MALLEGHGAVLVGNQGDPKVLETVKGLNVLDPRPHAGDGVAGQPVQLDVPGPELLLDVVGHKAPTWTE